MGFFSRLLGGKECGATSSQELGTDLRCANCARRIKEDEKSLDPISEWYNEWVPQGWWETSLLKCMNCGRIYSGDCVPRFMRFISGPEFAPRQCACGKSELQMIRDRRKGSLV